MNFNLFVSGTSDLGLEIAKNFNKKNNICICRDKNRANNLNYSKIIEIDLSKKFSFFKFKKIKKASLKNILFLNSYQNNDLEFFYKKNLKEILLYYIVNVVSSIRIFSFLQSNHYFANDCKIIFFSSRAGSISERGNLKHHLPGGDNLYRSSKAALNSFVKNLAFEFRDSQYTIVAYHPGWVRTTVGGKNADLSIKSATKYFIKFLKKISKKNTGKFYNYNLKEINW